MPDKMAPPPFRQRAERFLLLPPLEAEFGAQRVVVGDISISGVRIRHGEPMEPGRKASLRFRLDGETAYLSLECEIVWTQASLSADLNERHVSGVRFRADRVFVERIVDRLSKSGRGNRVRERRFSDRFLVEHGLDGELAGFGSVRILDLASKGARIETTRPVEGGTAGVFRFPIPKSSFEVRAHAEVVWCRVWALWGPREYRFHAGLKITERPELLRLAIGQLTELHLAVKDTGSLKLKLKIARAEQVGPAVDVDTVEDSIPGSEFFQLIQSVRALLAIPNDDARYWKELAEKTAMVEDIRARTGPITGRIDQIAAWEYLDRTLDPSIIALAFERHT
ncbi:MAG: PilZ domain-containing protein [Acidobacteria bacterium]|nr:PilZ domain-containing protein [Acidobacteriota bacterium]